ncbi:MAG: 1-acyl-sn-glycerol-3-phosphate acyltransferase [Litorimonas sp.]
MENPAASPATSHSDQLLNDATPIPAPSQDLTSSPLVDAELRRGNVVTRWIGRTALSLLDWELVGQPPTIPKTIIIAAPHTSNWDLILALSGMLALGMPIHFMMKREAFFWPLGSLWKAMGGIPVDRKSKNDLTTQIADWIKREDVIWIAITPEGTRSKVPGFRKGYLRIAQAANVPVFLYGVDSPRKQVVLHGVLPTTGDMDADAIAHHAYVAERYTGIKPSNH